MTIIPQPQYGRYHRTGIGQAILEFIGSKRSYTLNGAAKTMMMMMCCGMIWSWMSLFYHAQC